MITSNNYVNYGWNYVYFNIFNELLNKTKNNMSHPFSIERLNPVRQILFLIN